jgi:polysaccharide chain length determinant protein (PEP-CTERM system associated)
VEQQIPQRYVFPTSTSDIGDELQTMTQEVLSRTRLLGIIDEFGLYSKEKKRVAPEDIIELMRHDIEITPIEAKTKDKKINAFEISFIGENPRVAQGVASRVTSLFIEQNLKARTDQATNATDFLREQLEAAKTKLKDEEQRLHEFKMHNLGELPEQQQGNVIILAGLQAQLQSTTAALSRANEQRVYAETLLDGYRHLASRGRPVPGLSNSKQVVTPAEALEGDIARLQAEEQTLLLVYKSEHPNVVKVEREIEQKEAALERMKSSGAPKAEDTQTGAPSLGGTEDDTHMAQLKSQLEANHLEISNLSQDEKRLKAAVEQYQNRLNATPVREQQLAGIVRDYELMKQAYADLLGKQEQSELATSLEKHQGGQQFRLIDPPSLPTVPSSPNRLKISLGGAGAGLFLGLALALLKDHTDSSFHNEKELGRRFAGPLVLGLPLLLTPAQQRMRAWRQAFEALAGCILIAAVSVAEFYFNWPG